MNTKHPDVANAALNRCLRDLDHLAETIERLGIDPIEQNLEEIETSKAALKKIQSRFFETNPEFEYHEDPNRPPTDYMREIDDLLADAKSAIEVGDTDRAKALIREAAQKEPPSSVVREIMKLAVEAADGAA